MGQTLSPVTGRSSCSLISWTPCVTCQSDTPGGGSWWGAGPGTAAVVPLSAYCEPSSSPSPTQRATSFLKMGKNKTILKKKDSYLNYTRLLEFHCFTFRSMLFKYIRKV